MFKSSDDTIKTGGTSFTNFSNIFSLMLVLFMLGLLGIILFEAKKDPVALKYFENAYRADSSSLEPLYGEAMYWQNQENFTEAKKVFTRIISIDRTYPTSYYNMGWMLMQEDSTEKAIRQFGIAIQVKPDYFQAYYNRGLCHEILGDIPKAIEDYKQSL